MIIAFLSVCIAGGIVTAVSGFGFVVLVMMFFPYILPSYGAGVAVCGILSVLSSGYLTVRLRRNVRWKRIAVPAAAYFAVNTAVIAFASVQPDAVLKKLLAVTLILLSIYFIFFGGKIGFRPTVSNGIIFGAISGILGGFFSVSGPPIVLYMLAASEDNDTYMANIQAYFTVTSLYSCVMRLIYGMIDIPMLLYSGIGFIAVLAGLYLGKKLFSRLDAAMLQRVIYAVMMFCGIVMLF
jgi:uncharacterized membrane protein YfcA